MVALDDDDLEGVAGGFYYIGGDGQGAAFKVHDKCRNDYTDTSCNNSDACGNLVHFYYDCSGKYFKKDEENDCAFSLYCELALRWK